MKARASCSCGWDGSVDLYPATEDTRDEPGSPDEIEPGDCPECGEELNLAEILEHARDDEQDAREEQAAIRAETRQMEDRLHEWGH